MRYIKTAVHILLIALIQTMLCPYIKIGNTIPDFLFIYVLFTAIHRPKLINVMIISALCGAVTDCLTGRIFGNYVLVYMTAAVGVFSVNESIFRNNLIINIITAFFICIAAKSLFYVINISILKDVGYFYSLMTIILPEAVYNIIIYTFIELINRKLKKSR